MIIDEQQLDEFRSTRLSPRALLDLLEKHVWVLLRLGVGVGKSAAVDALLGVADLYARFDLVLYVAPSWDVIRERRIVAGLETALVPFKVIQPRPVDRCGRFAKRWTELERQSCITLAKETLCRECRAAQPADARCEWPYQMRSLKGVRLVFTSEQRLHLIRSLVPLLKARTGAERVLVILDEAKFLDSNFEVEIPRPAMAMFRDVLADATNEPGTLASAAARWRDSVNSLLACRDEEACSQLPLDLPTALLRFALRVERVGIQRFGSRFRFLGYDLLQLRFSQPEERWAGAAGIRFVARPYLGAHVLVASAHLDDDYVGHRLGTDRIASPFKDVFVRHSESRILNLKSRLGADRYFAKNSAQILDTFAVLLLRNIRAGRTTIFVSRQKSKGTCAERLSARLRMWGEEVRFVTDGSKTPGPPDPRVVPVIHYGVLGTNDYCEYECAYCLNGYYISSNVLFAAVSEFEPGAFGTGLRIVCGHSGSRKAEFVPRVLPDLDRTWIANLYLRRLEIDPVLQAAGRVRFLTKPREVVFFQAADLGPDIGDVQEVASLAALRLALEVPSAKEIDGWRDAERLRALMDAGDNAETAAEKLGISRATAFRRLAGESLNSPLREFLLKGDVRLPVGAAEPGGAP